ncbi:10986_t:CDS:10, partial [Funneliformis caledonium]
MYRIDLNNKVPTNIPPGVPASTNLSKIQYWRHLVPDEDVWRAKGSSIIDRSFTEVTRILDKISTSRFRINIILSSATSSRLFFPRGFYCLDIIKHWVSLIDGDGWVAREQIWERKLVVPVEFQTQYPYYANPPTLLFAIKAFIERVDDVENKLKLGADDVIGQHIFNEHITSTTDHSKYFIKLNYKWLRRTQWGVIKEWRRKAKVEKLIDGVVELLSMPPTPPHPAELHVDLMCWVGFMARTLKNIAEKMMMQKILEKNIKISVYLFANVFMLDLHWSEEHDAFRDLSVEEDEESVFVCHKGYLSLFPIVLELLPNDSPKLGAILDMIHNPKELWSRSLSKSKKLFHTGEDYWKGNIWININYLVLSSIYKNYAIVEGLYKEKAKAMYDELRNNIIKNVYK